VLDLGRGRTDELGEVVDPLWEADGKHVRATRLSRKVEDRGAATDLRSSSLKIRWDRVAKTSASWGPGSAQIPAPRGTGLAWSEDQRTSLAPSHCAVRLGRSGHQHPIVGPFCMGIADDRGVRWSPDGRWLAFPRPGPVPGERKPGTFFVDVVGIEGGRHPALSALYARVGPRPAAIAAGPGAVWMDWSPSQRFLALQDGAGDLRIYDFERGDIAFLGKGECPTWSPGGGYLLVLSARQTGTAVVEAFVWPGASRADSIAFWPVRDARWLPAAACSSRGS
jgi:hypothetical protein